MRRTRASSESRGLAVGVVICMARVAGATLVAASVLASPLLAQRPVGRQFEGRVDLIAADTPSLQAGLGLNIPAGIYVRMGATIAGGVAHRDAVTHGAARGDVVARFLLDPYREFPLGLYGLGGLSAMYDPFEGWRPRVVAGVGLESRVRRGRAIAAELALGGGVRLGVAVRRARRSGR